MKDVLLKYMESRFKIETDLEQMISESSLKPHGPVITVSRETGCSGNDFVKELSVFLNRQESNSGQIIWQWVNKEIIYETAKELQVHPSRIYKLFRGEPRKLMDEIVESLSIKYYKNDRVITKAVKEIVKKIASRGNIIILGRGGVGLTRHIKNSLHIKLYAPKPWRIESVARKFNISSKEAADFVDKKDRERDLIINKFITCDNPMDAFDIGINCMTSKRSDIFYCIAGLMRSRGLE